MLAGKVCLFETSGFSNGLKSSGDFLVLLLYFDLVMSKEAEISTSHKVIEGKALITFPNSNEVFYNPVQVFNRDVSVACIHVFKEDLFPQTVKYEKKKKQKTNNNDNKNTDVSQTEQSSNGMLTNNLS